MEYAEDVFYPCASSRSTWLGLMNIRCNGQLAQTVLRPALKFDASLRAPLLTLSWSQSWSQSVWCRPNSLPCWSARNTLKARVHTIGNWTRGLHWDLLIPGCSSHLHTLYYMFTCPSRVEPHPGCALPAYKSLVSECSSQFHTQYIYPSSSICHGHLRSHRLLRHLPIFYSWMTNHCDIQFSSCFH